MQVTKAYFEVEQLNHPPVRWITLYATYQNNLGYFKRLIQIAHNDGFVFDDDSVIIEQAVAHSARHKSMYAIRVEVNDNDGNYQEYKSNPFDF